MSRHQVEGCVATAAGPLRSDTKAASQPSESEEEAKTMSVKVGKEAPDFEAMAFHEGGFKPIKLSDFRGKWVFLCFYPGDFTFV
jgi:peroxiredoxin (alkyl hydroperoxide reductase subunit C)